MDPLNPNPSNTNSEEITEEDSPLRQNDECIALIDFDGQQDEDLPFCQGEHITIIRPSEVLFWYEAENSEGQTGLVPRTFLQRVGGVTNENRAAAPAGHGADYIPMQTANPATGQLVPQAFHEPRPNIQHPSDHVDLESLRIQEREKQRRLQAGTLVIGTCQFIGVEDGDLSFTVYEEMSLLYPMRDLCWYYARKTDRPEEKGVIPVTHVRLVYMSDDEDDERIYKTPTKPTHDRLYDDVNDFVSQSGWFSFPGLAHGKTALIHVLAKKSKLSYDKLMSIQQATYMFDYRHGEKVFVGSAEVLSDALCKHFECFGKPRGEIGEIDDELCHHTDSSEWEITVWELQTQDLEVETAKKVIEQEALVTKESQKGLTEKINFTSMAAFDKFWEWFSPN